MLIVCTRMRAASYEHSSSARACQRRGHRFAASVHQYDKIRVRDLCVMYVRVPNMKPQRATWVYAGSDLRIRTANLMYMWQRKCGELT